MDLNVMRALHIIFMVCWFAGLLYIGRLFVYYVEAKSKDASPQVSRQLHIMMKRLFYIITWPSGILTTVIGLHLLMQTGALSYPWMHAKLGCVCLLWVYHIWCHRCVTLPQRLPSSSRTLRIANEVPSVLLIAIVFFVSTRTIAVGIPVLGTVIFFGVLAVVLSKLVKIEETV
jgi:putative membrane protein